MIRRVLFCGIVSACTALAAFSQSESRATSAQLPKLAKPVRIAAGGKPIDAITGHAAPLVFDWNKDGVQDLLVGEYGAAGGRLRIYLNTGTNKAPKLDSFTHLAAGGADATVPSS